MPPATQPYDHSTPLGRLQQLHDDLHSWLHDPDPAIHLDLGVFYLIQKRLEPCGTFACLLGYCASQPWAQEQGLHLSKGNSNIPKYSNGGDLPFVGVSAAEVFFELNADEAITIFEGPTKLCSQKEEALSRLDFIHKIIQERLHTAENTPL